MPGLMRRYLVRCISRHQGLTLLMLVFMALSPIGCQKKPLTGEVSGSVKLGTTLLQDGLVVFEDPSRGIGASAEVKNGTYKITTPVPVGEYKVIVQGPSAGPPTAAKSPTPRIPIPPSYAQASTTPLKATIIPGANSLDFEVK